MKALFLSRRYVERTKSSGKSMVILEVFALPHVKDDGTGELAGGGVKTYFINNPNHFDIAKTNKLGDVIELKMELDEVRNVGIPVGTELIAESTIDLMKVIS